MPDTSDLQNAILRIQQMEALLDSVLLTMQTSCPLQKDAAFQDMIQKLSQYYQSGLWLNDYDLDACGKLPSDLKRGVLAQDTLYDLLCKVEG